MSGSRHTKGVNVIDFVRVLKTLHKSGQLRDIDAVEAKYLNERILVSSWYPFEDFRALMHRVHRAMGGTHETADKMGEHGAQAALTGVHKIFLREGDAAGTAKAIGRIWEGQFDFGRAHVTDLPNGFSVRFDDYPDVDRVHGHLLVGSIRKALELARGTPGTVELHAAPWRGDLQLEIRVSFEG